MKSCPKCNRTFPDEGQKFCTFDGGLLIAPQTFDPNATMRATSIDLNAASERPTSRDLPDPNATIIENYPATVALPRNTGPTLAQAPRICRGRRQQLHRLRLHHHHRRHPLLNAAEAHYCRSRSTGDCCTFGSATTAAGSAKEVEDAVDHPRSSVVPSSWRRDSGGCVLPGRQTPLGPDGLPTKR